jgi:hypothetical protein
MRVKNRRITRANKVGRLLLIATTLTAVSSLAWSYGFARELALLLIVISLPLIGLVAMAESKKANKSGKMPKEKPRNVEVS